MNGRVCGSPVCGKPQEGRSRYCNSTCRSRASRARKATLEDVQELADQLGKDAFMEKMETDPVFRDSIIDMAEAAYPPAMAKGFVDQGPIALPNRPHVRRAEDDPNSGSARNLGMVMAPEMRSDDDRAFYVTDTKNFGRSADHSETFGHWPDIDEAMATGDWSKMVATAERELAKVKRLINAGLYFRDYDVD